MTAAISSFRGRLAADSPLSGIVVRTPSHQVLEVLSADLSVRPDAVMIDTEHAAISPDQLDAMLAISVALDLPGLVRLGAMTRTDVQQAMDLGACGLVVPHVDSAEAALTAVRWSHYGPGGRGYSGSTRAGRWGTASMTQVVDRAQRETTVIAQVEDPDGVEAIEEIVSVEGLDAIFIGEADLTVAMGQRDPNHDAVTRAVEHVVKVCRGAGMPIVAFAASAAAEARWRQRGASLVFVGTDQARLRIPLS